jgi:hypothetical protein
MKGTYKAVEVSARGLVRLAIEADGSLDRWKRFTTRSVHGINGGVFRGKGCWRPKPLRKREISDLPKLGSRSSRKWRTAPIVKE